MIPLPHPQKCLFSARETESSRSGRHTSHWKTQRTGAELWKHRCSAASIRVKLCLNCGCSVFQRKKKPKQKPTASSFLEEAEAKEDKAAAQEPQRPAGRKRRSRGREAGMETVNRVGSQKVTSALVLQPGRCFLAEASFPLSMSLWRHLIDQSGGSRSMHLGLEGCCLLV